MRTTLLMAAVLISLAAVAAPASADISTEQTTTTCPNDGDLHYHTYGNNGNGCLSIPTAQQILEMLTP